MVLGAGPAGSAAALRACHLGLTVALIDKARFPRDKLCGGGITGRCADFLADQFAPLPEGLFVRSDSVDLVAGDRRVARVDDIVPLRFTHRRAFDAALAEQALAAGAEDLTGQRVASIDPTTATVTLRDGRRLTGRVLLGADGVNSATARALFGRAHDPAQIGFALEAEVPLPPDGSGAVPRLDLTAARWGYAWSFPKTDGLTLGIGGRQAMNADLSGTFRDWLLAQGADPSRLRIKGHHLPMGERRPDPARGRVLLAGDAAGFVDPITGEGIGWALHSGRLAAEAATAADPARAYLAATAPLRRELATARLLARAVYHPRLQPRFLALLEGSARLQRRYMDLLGGRMDYADLSPLRLARLALRLWWAGSARRA